jgi:hypothetical protein
MSKKFIITENEKRHIKKLYGIITEQINQFCTKFNESTKTNVVDYDEIISSYKTKLNTEDLNVVFSSINNDIQSFASNLNSKGIAERPSCQMGLINIRPRFKDKNIIIVDSRQHTIYLFDKTLNDVTPYQNPEKKSPIPIITGREKQSTEENWKEFNLLNFEERRSYIAKIKNKNISDVSNNEVFEFSGGASLNPGIYTTNKLNDITTYLKTLDGKRLSQAIHKVLDVAERKNALIKSSDRTISDLDDETKNKELMMSSGCINIPEWLTNNSKYQEIANDAYVFNISDETENYYVKVENIPLDDKCYSPKSVGAESIA